MSRQIKELYEFGEFSLDVDERRLQRRDGTSSTPLPEKAFQTLVHLVRNRGKLVKKEELLATVWPDTIVEENNLGKAIHAIRQSLGDSSADPRFIETVPKHGYRFVADVRTAQEPASQEADNRIGPAAQVDARASDEAPPTPRMTTPPTRKATSRGWAIFVVGLLVFSGLMFGLNAGGVRDKVLGSLDPVRIDSLAITPLSDLSPDGSQVYFADGMTEALTTDLARIGSLRVTSRQAVLKLKAEGRTLNEIGRELQVDAVLTGSVVHAADRVNVTVKLVNPTNDRILWTNSYERDLRDVLVLQREVARDVAREIRATLTPQEQMTFGGAGPVHPGAYDHYLRGRFYLYRQKREENGAAIDSLERSVALDPAFAAAHAELAQAYAWRIFLFDPDDKALAERAFIAAEKALALDPNMAVAYLARGRLLWTPANRFPHEMAIREYRRALELDPNLDEARNQLALVYNHIGLLDDALKELELALALNPSNSLAQFRVGETLLFKGDHEIALSHLRKVPSDANPALVGHQIVWALYNLERGDEAEAEIERFLKEFPDDNRGLLTSQQAVIAASKGQAAVAEEKIKVAIEKGRGFGHFHHTAFFIACAYALMNKPDQAVEWLIFAADNGFPNYPLFEHTKPLENLKDYPQFRSVMKKWKAQWEQLSSLP